MYTYFGKKSKFRTKRRNNSNMENYILKIMIFNFSIKVNKFLWVITFIYF